MNQPVPNELVELLFTEVIFPPDGYEYYPNNIHEQLLYPVYGQDKWRVLLHKSGTSLDDPNNFRPIFMNGDFIRGVARALQAMQDAVDASIVDAIPEKVQ